MRLLYEWIKTDRNNVFDNCGINFTEKYNISYDNTSRTLKIQKNKNSLPNNFYSVNGAAAVDQVTCILGNNGGGKTCLLKHIYYTDLLKNPNERPEGQYFESWNTIQVLEYDGEINVYHNQEGLKVDTDIKYNMWDITSQKNAIQETPETGSYARTTKLYISNDAYVSMNRNFSNEGFQKCVSFTPYDIGVLKSEFFNTITPQGIGLLVFRNLVFKLNRRLKEYTDPQFIQQLFYVMFLRELVKTGKRGIFSYLHGVKATFQRLDLSDPFIDTYNTLSLIIGKLGAENIIRETTTKNEIEDMAKSLNIIVDHDLLKICAVHYFVKQKNDCASSNIYQNLKLNLITEILLSLSDYDEDILTYNTYDDVDLLLAKLHARIEDMREDVGRQFDVKQIKQEELDYFRAAFRSIKSLKSIIPETETSESISIDDNEKFLDLFYGEIDSDRSFMLKYFYLSYNCSAGERALLNIFSDLNCLKYFGALTNYAKYGVNKNIILLLDEPDLYCHPEWQRKMLYEMISLLGSLYAGYKFHIIFSTHSPLFLSDIPLGNIVRLSKTNEGAYRVSCGIKPTFGANIFDLYSDEFVLDSYIGEFAQYKIGDCIKKVASRYYQTNEPMDEELEETEKLIDLIGEPILRHKLKTMLSQIKNRR